WVDNSGAETGFLLQRSMDGKSGWSDLATPSADTTSYTDPSVPDTTTYYYRVEAQQGSTASTWSPSAGASTADTLVVQPPMGADPQFGTPDGHFQMDTGPQKLVFDFNQNVISDPGALVLTNLSSGDEVTAYTESSTSETNRTYTFTGTGAWGEPNALLPGN